MKNIAYILVRTKNVKNIIKTFPKLIHVILRSVSHVVRWIYILFLNSFKKSVDHMHEMHGKMFVSRETPADNWATVLTHPLYGEMGTLSISRLFF